MFIRQFWAVVAGTTLVLTGTAGMAPIAAASGGRVATPPLVVKTFGRLPDGTPRFARSGPTGLSPSAIQGVYSLSGLSPRSGAGTGQTIAIVDAYHDPNALNDLNAFDKQYGYPRLSTCTQGQTSACFSQYDPQGTPSVNTGWVLEESLDIEWAHAEAPGARIILVEAASSGLTDLFNAVVYANGLGATEVSMSWDSLEFGTETAFDADLARAGTFYTVASGDTGNHQGYPAASPNVIAVGGTTLTGCSGTSCSGFSGETAWSSSGGGVSAYESIPGYQSGYTGPVYGGGTGIASLTGTNRGIPDVSFDAGTDVSIYDSTRYYGQSGWFSVGGTSVGAPNWAGILAAGTAAGKTALQGDAAIYGGGYSNLRDITSGTDGSCVPDCTAGTGYDLVTGLGSPVNYP